MFCFGFCQHDASEAEIRLNCQVSTKRGQNGRGKQPNFPSLHVRLRPPASYGTLSRSTTLYNSDEDVESDRSSSTLATPWLFRIYHVLIYFNRLFVADDSDTLTSPSTPTGTEFEQAEVSGPLEMEKPRKRRVRGYSVDPDNEDMDDECSIEDDFDDFCFEDDPLLQDPTDLDGANRFIGIPPISIGSWLVASLLPRYADQVSVDSTMSIAESTVSRFSIYLELREASLDEDFEKIKASMMTEWTYVGACVSEVVGFCSRN